MHRVACVLHAVTEDEVEELGHCVHDAEFEWERVGFDAELREATVPFAQEPLEPFDLPEPALVGTGRRGARIYRVPYYRGWITVRRARRLGIALRGRDDGVGELGALAYDRERGAIRAYAAIGPDVLVDVDAIDVSLTMTDEIAFEMRRTVRRGSRLSVPWRD